MSDSEANGPKGGRRARDAARWMAYAGAAWALVIALDIGAFSLDRAIRPEWMGPLPARLAILLRIVSWCGWWLWTPVVFLAARRFPFERGRLTRSAVVHLGLALVVVESNWLVMLGVRAALGLSARMPALSPAALLQYAAVCAIAVVIQRERASRKQEIEKARLESQLAEARRQTLVSQLHPHFLFNALNGIAMLIRARSYDSALDAVVAYGDLLRELQTAGAAEVPLRQEVAFIERYLSVERMRFGERLRATVSIDRHDADALVPSLLLQPLVENAMRHGFADLEEGAHLDIMAFRKDGNLRLEVRDNGVGLPRGWRRDSAAGVGLRNTGARLQSLYGAAHRFELSSQPRAGTTVLIEIPYHVAPV